MKTHFQDPSRLADKISDVEAKLDSLELEIKEIGQPAARDLQHRLDQLNIEEKALKRNFEESQRADPPDVERLQKVEALLRHIENEKSSVEQDADFLQQAAPSSVTLAVEAGAHMVELYRRGVKRVIGDSHPLGSSVFVNRTHEDLVEKSGPTP